MSDANQPRDEVREVGERFATALAALHAVAGRASEPGILRSLYLTCDMVSLSLTHAREQLANRYTIAVHKQKDRQS